MSSASRVSLRGVRAYGRHGADPGEREYAQPLDIDLHLDVDLDAAARSDDLADTIDYATVHRRVVDLVAGTSFALLERLCSRILEDALRDPRVARAEVTIAKPRLLDGATPAVTLVATRSSSAG